jgi:hypothetical protein
MVVVVVRRSRRSVVAEAPRHSVDEQPHGGDSGVHDEHDQEVVADGWASSHPLLNPRKSIVQCSKLPPTDDQ